MELRAVTEIGEILVGDKLLIWDMNELRTHTVTSLEDDTVQVDNFYDIEPNSYGQWIIITKDEEN